MKTQVAVFTIAGLLVALLGMPAVHAGEEAA